MLIHHLFFKIQQFYLFLILFIIIIPQFLILKHLLLFYNFHDHLLPTLSMIN